MSSGNASKSTLTKWQLHRICYRLANRNISRPNLSQLRAAGQVGVADQFINAGNPNLERFVADSFETSLEYYGDSSSVALAFFMKDMDSFIVQQSQTLPYNQTGYPLEFLAFDPRVTETSEFNVSQPINGDKADVSGIEFAFQADFTFLPAPFDQLGALGNITLADGETTLFNEGEAIKVTPPGLSETSYNFTLYFETEVWGARVSASYRDNFITGEGSEQNIVAGFDETTFVDFKTFYNLNDSTKLTFEATNLTDERIRQFLDHRTQSFTESGRNFAVGVSYQF
ncbi:TonB-dependent receptor [Paraglaciecola agarilytica]|uniref:TonB-dependent receptor domain-containing protein n=1 Tax=Paraglaciecola chathamensis TaxID=368405 RepID=UPI001C09DB4F|nr:TonB-dependent receptor [Paraglaciecola agarilytica]